MVQTTPVTNSQNTTQDGRLRCIIVSSSTRRNNHSHEEPWPIMLYGPCFNPYSFNMMRQNLPSWVAFWLLLSSIICAIDAFFVLLRPHTLPGGKWNYLFKPCEYGAFYTPLFSRLCFWLENCIFGDLWTGEDADPKWERQEDRDARGLEGSGKKCTFSSH